ncbi:MAG: hypothetical protein Tsb0026_03640 [Sulfuricaulis sp.]
MLTLIVILKALAEIAGLALLGQGVLYILAGARREQNVFYRVIKVITSPMIRVTRFITPRFVADAHIPFVAFFLVAGLWLAFTIEKVAQCRQQPQHSACQALQRNAGSPPGP